MSQPANKLSGWFPDLSLEVHKKLETYHHLLIKYNPSLNLVSETSLLKAELVHFSDSILAMQGIADNLDPNLPVYDLGSGNGFPGLVLGILRPDLKVVLVDRDERKLEFCKVVIKDSQLGQVKIQRGPIEELGQDAIKQAVTRGLANLGKAMLMLRGVTAKGGEIYHMKSENWTNELSMAPPQLFSVWDAEMAFEYELPDDDTKGYVVRTKKIS